MSLRNCTHEATTFRHRGVSPTGVKYIRTNCRRCGACLGDENE